MWEMLEKVAHLNSISGRDSGGSSRASHSSANEVGAKVEVVQGEHRTAGMGVCVGDGRCRPVMAVQDVRPAPSIPTYMLACRPNNIVAEWQEKTGQHLQICNTFTCRLIHL